MSRALSHQLSSNRQAANSGISKLFIDEGVAAHRNNAKPKSMEFAAVPKVHEHDPQGETGEESCGNPRSIPKEGDNQADENRDRKPARGISGPLALNARSHPNENEMSDGWRESASLRVEGGIS